MFNETKTTGILLIILGPIVAWIGSFLLYGFGQMVESTEKTEADIAEIKRCLTNRQGADPVVAQPYQNNPQKPSARPFRESKPVPAKREDTLRTYQDLLNKGKISPEAFEEVKRQISGLQ